MRPAWVEKLDRWSDWLIIILIALAVIHSDDPAQRAAYTMGLLIFSRLVTR